MCRSYLPGLDAVVTLDARFDDASAEANGVSVMTGWTPLPRSVFFAGTGSRPVDVGFVGRFSAHYRDRLIYIRHLRNAGIDVKVHSNDDGTRLTVEEMGDFLRSCKIVLNFSSTAVISAWELNNRAPTEVPLVDHVKGRVFEAISCGALLLESKNACTPAYFTPGLHYAEFSGMEDLVEKIRYFLDHEEERERIARAGLEHFEARYSGARFWSNLEKTVDGTRTGPGSDN